MRVPNRRPSVDDIIGDPASRRRWLIVLIGGIAVSAQFRQTHSRKGNDMCKWSSKAAMAIGLFALLGIFGRSAHAGSAFNAKIVEVVLSGQGTVAWITLDQTISGSPGCATASTIFIFDPTTTGGKNLLLAVQTAFLASKPVSADGTGACVTGGGPPAENLSFISTKP